MRAFDRKIATTNMLARGIIWTESRRKIIRSAPQIPPLKQSVLCITHAGLNTTLESLTQGVPLVAMPITSDQPGVARRIAYTKAGAYVPFQDATAPRIRSLIDEVLDNPEYRHNAAAMQRAIAETDGLERAVDILERAFHAQGNTTENETLAAR
jgi:zeaxanthin glucosyltransferase